MIESVYQVLEDIAIPPRVSAQSAELGVGVLAFGGRIYCVNPSISVPSA